MASSAKNTSSAMSAVNSSQGIPPLPPPPSGSQRNAEKKPTPIFSKPPTSSSSYTPTTSDLFTLILQMKGHIQQQDKTNERILREIGDIKKQKRSVEDHSPLMPRSLNFDTLVITSQHSAAPAVQYVGGPRGMHYGSSVMTQASGSYFQPAESLPQHMGSFASPGGYFGTQQIQGSLQVQGSSQIQGFWPVQGSS
ncbi:hypothetical protein Hanom_Chr06g00548301 [Helianthus anomalus]